MIAIFGNKDGWGVTAGQTVIAERLAEDAAYALMTRLTSTALPTDIPVGSEYYVNGFTCRIVDMCDNLVCYRYVNKDGAFALSRHSRAHGGQTQERAFTISTETWRTLRERGVIAPKCV